MKWLRSRSQALSRLSHTLLESLRTGCDLSQRLIIVLASSGGKGMRHRFGLLAEYPKPLTSRPPGKELDRSRKISVESNEPPAEANITLVYDFTYDSGGLYKTGYRHAVYHVPPCSRARRSPAHRTAKQTNGDAEVT
jgi:hypothetical protein